MNKTAVDAAAKTYWEKLYGDYGTQLTRDIPRRIKAALVANKKVAAVSQDAVLIPSAIAKTAAGVVVEGLYTDASAKMLFSATLDVEGNVKEVSSIEIK